MQTVSDIDDRSNDFDDDKTMTIFHSAAARHASEFWIRGNVFGVFNFL